MDAQITFSSAFLLGFLGSAHCLGMCGGLAGALGMSTFQHTARLGADFDLKRFLYLSSYHFGRIFSYTLAGSLVGLLGLWLGNNLILLDFLRYVAAIMLILLGLYLGQWFNGLIAIEKQGGKLWRHIQPLGQRFMPPKNYRDALLLGMVWGWLPCGLVYSALIWASARSNMAESALIMLCFGLGTLPSMLLTSVFAQKLISTLKARLFRQIAGLVLIGFGVWSLPTVQGWLMR
jgi:uncharacterized protein